MNEYTITKITMDEEQAVVERSEKMVNLENMNMKNWGDTINKICKKNQNEMRNFFL